LFLDQFLDQRWIAWCFKNSPPSFASTPCLAGTGSI